MILIQKLSEYRNHLASNDFNMPACLIDEAIEELRKGAVSRDITPYVDDLNALNESLGEQLKALALKNEKLENDKDRLRGNLQNCVNHLDRAKRKYASCHADECIESANKALYETLIEE